MKIKTRHQVLGLALVIAASLLLAIQTDFSFKKKDQINMYVFKDKASLNSLEITKITPDFKENLYFKDFSIS